MRALTLMRNKHVEKTQQKYQATTEFKFATRSSKASEEREL